MANALSFKNIHSQLWPQEVAQKSLIMCDTGKDDAVMLCCADTHDNKLNINSIVTYGGNVSAMRTCNNTQFILSKINADKNVSFHELSEASDNDASHVHGASGLGGYSVDEVDSIASTMKKSQVNYDQLANELIHSNSVNNVISTGPLTGMPHLFNAIVKQCGGNTQMLQAALSKLRVVIMGGAMDHANGNKGKAEFNFYLDSKAANKTFQFINKHAVNTILVPLDLTHQCVFKPEDFKSIEGDRTSKEEVFYDLFKKHTPARGLEPAHDVHTITALSNPEMYEGQFEQVRVSPKDGRVFKGNGESSVFVLSKLDSEAFKMNLLDALKKN